MIGSNKIFKFVRIPMDEGIDPVNSFLFRHLDYKFIKIFFVYLKDCYNQTNTANL